ncbi:amylo-alpha-1,6-glucosidase [Cohnella luojiensis]|uniref:Amylo-alpha-1,6-glucosidase n=1 Tax=Cohnella luojiensis TaxID=652876 RepID=A0A4Y8LPD7_9BACL|nr:amylo-alpha-1,6-glucosidase [Cohnella luojiensis]TFE22869.1 amylo-alpha-1,6-glucosidase [Cohnella luojiensis]
MDYRVIKENDIFLTTDKSGDIPAENSAGLGLYMKDTRFLNRMELFINGEKPLLLTSSAEENYVANILLTNKHMERDGELLLWRESVEIQRVRFIFGDIVYETVKLSNFSPKPLNFEFSAAFAADFKDMFIVRGYNDATNGIILPVEIRDNLMIFRYGGTDGIQRETRIDWDLEHELVDESGEVFFRLSLLPAENREITFTITPSLNGALPLKHQKEQAVKLLTDSYRTWFRKSTWIRTDLVLYDELYDRGLQDLRVLLTDIGYGSFPVAGLPLFAVPFGRDSLIAALQMLPSNPQIAKGTLKTMAAFQGTKVDLWRDEQPGKIMHELRSGELANTNQIPFNPYYGTIDSTPLFLVLLAEYYHWTEDLELVKELFPQAEKALMWINEYGDRDKDGFVEYHQESSKGIANQGWKDSGDSIIHENGDYGHAPIALVEVQGYVYQAKTKLAPILRLLGKDELADRIHQDAQELKKKFNQSFWMDDHKYFAIALDSRKNQVRSVTSNPGHALMSGIVEEAKAAEVAKRLVSSDMFSGYGIRTMSSESAGFNPMSYHDGSVWPHDNSICLMGLGALGFKEEASIIMSGMLKAAKGFEYSRLPELFCGYDISRGSPVPYPVACSPQAWAAGTPIVFLQVMLGIVPDAIAKTITLDPVLPQGMDSIQVERLAIGQGHLDLHVLRVSEKAYRVNLSRNTTGYRVVVKESVLLQR